MWMRIAAAAVAVWTVAGCSTNAPTTSTVSTTGSGAATQVIDEVAVNSRGEPINGYTETAAPGISEVDCTLPSPAAVADNIYTCSPSAAGADVCWPAAGLDLLCLNDPWVKRLHRVHARAALPPVNPRDHPQPAALLLDDGSHCRLRNGGSWSGRDDGYLGAYWCGAGRAVVLTKPGTVDTIDRSSPVWTVKVGKLGAAGQSLPPSTVTVVTAWFAGDGGSRS